MKYFKHGDSVTHTDLNTLVTAINNLETEQGLNSYAFGSKDAALAGVIFYGVHRRRWIVYRSTGEIRSLDYIINPSDEDNPLAGYRTELPDCNEEFCMFDTHTVGWLKYGDMYAVEGSEFALETDTDA